MDSRENRIGSASQRKGRISAATTVVCLCAAVAALYVGTETQIRLQWQPQNTIAELRELPLGQVRLGGVVTFVDTRNRRFWLQDETGAIAINEDPRLADTRVADMVQIETNKTHAYDPSVGFSSLGLTNFKIIRKQRNAPLPLPQKAAIQTLSEKMKAGTRVTVEGVIHNASTNGNGVVAVYLGDQGKEVQAFVPGDPLYFARLLNARVRLTGVLEVLLDAGGSATSNLLWVQQATDLETISSAPPSTIVSTVRSIYADGKHIDANLVRLRGKVLYQDSPSLIVVEDQWGALACHLQRPAEVTAGSTVEVRGFLERDGVEIHLTHAVATQNQGDFQLESSPRNPVTTIAGVRAIPEQVIRTSPPVRVTGVITYLDPEYRQFFLQDSSAGIFLKYAGSPVSLYRGERITVIGMAAEGDFAPVIIAPKFISIGPAPLPKPVPMNLQAEFGVLDSLYGEIEGVVHPTGEKQVPKHTTFYLSTSLGRVHVDLTQDGTQDDLVAGLQDATVRLRGVSGEVFNSRKQLIGLQMSISDTKDIRVIEAGSSDPFNKTATPISDLLKYSPHSRPDHRLVVSGTITMLGDGYFYLQDATGGVRIESGASGLHLGDVVGAAGYAAPTGYSPVFTDAVMKTQRASSTVVPQPVQADAMSDGHLDSQLVTVQAKLLHVENSLGARTLSVLSGGHTFQAVFYSMDTGGPFVPPQVGSLLQLTGICSADVTLGNTRNLFNKDPVAFKLLLRSPSDIHVLKGGNWWTFRRSLIVVGILILAVLISAGRIIVLLRRIDSKNDQLRKAGEKENAIRQLINAMQEVRAKKQFTSRVSLPDADELAQLGAEFNHMIEELNLRDIAMAEAEGKLQHQALSDVLTGLPNRRLLSDRLSKHRNCKTGRQHGGSALHRS